MHDEEHLLLLTLHHILADAWSFGILSRELSILYTAFCGAAEPALVELPLQYADYALWQREETQELQRQAHLDYWCEQLAQVPALLELPTDRPRQPQTTFRGASLSFSIPLALANALRALSQQEGTTLFMTLLAAFQVLLMRYSGQSDIVVGTPFASRTRQELEHVVGLFLNTLVLRTQLSGQQRFTELLGRVREVCLEAYEHAEVPFEQLVEALQPARSLSYTPLFQVMFVMQNVPPGWLSLPGVTLEEVEVDRGTARFDLTLEIVERGAELLGSFEYSTDLFDEATIARLVANYQRLLQGIAARPQQYIRALPLLSEQERLLLLRRWNHPSVARDVSPRTLHQLIEEQAARTPDALALASDEGQLTYQELDRRANQLARHLRRLGVEPGSFVAICVERSSELILGILATLKAGAAYMPLDPAYPGEWLTFVLWDAPTPVVLTQERLLARLPVEVNAVCLDRERHLFAHESDTGLAAVVQPAQPAYLIYTSGSTGQPKGVVVRHHNIVASLRARFAYYPDPPDSFPLLSSQAFDSSIVGIFWTLSGGGRLILPAADAQFDSTALLALLEREQVSHLLGVPSFYRVLLEQPETGWQAALKRVIVVGETCPPELAHMHMQRLPHVEFYNEYGPTEAAVWSSVYRCTSGERRPSIPIGRPIQGTQLYVLDRQLEPVPIGVPGELYIGGAGVAGGYLGRPELTAERFLPDPFSRQPGARLYRTGDRACYLADGNLEFLGRIDRQVKLRGFRIELEEIEAHLRQHNAVQDAVVSVREDQRGNPLLAAYIVAAPAHPVPSGAELRAFLQGRLPVYMLPAQFATLAALPLLPNGKVDRGRLPMPAGGETREAVGTGIAPRTPLEERLAAIWCEVLGRERVGVYDNFFELGGDSIQIIQINARAQQQGIQLLPRQMFQHQTIAALAGVAREAAPVAVEQGPVVGPLPLTPIQRWFFEAQQPEPHHYNQSQLLEGEVLDPLRLEGALTALLEHHDALRLRFTRDQQGQPTQYIADLNSAGRLAFAWIDLAALAPREQQRALPALLKELQASLHLERGPLFRAAFVDLGPATPAKILLVAHHLVVDAVSWRILLEDLETAYRQLSREEPPRLPAKTSSFKRWAEQLTTFAASTELLQEAGYWLSLLERNIPDIPLDRYVSREENTEEWARVVSCSLDAAETRALLQEVPGVYHTQINDLLLAALALAVRGWSGAHSFLIDLEGHGREEIGGALDLSRTVGWFTSLFPVVLDLADVREPGEVITMIKEQLRQVPNRGIGYGVLRYLAPQRELIARLRSLPGAQISFNYLGYLDQAGEQASLFRPAWEQGTSNFSLKARRSHMLDILGGVSDGQLRLTWIYSARLHDRATIERLAQRYLEELRRLIAHCLSPQAGGHTPSDFPLAQLNARALQKIAQLIGEDE